MTYRYDAARAAARNRSRAYEVVVKALEKAALEKGMTRKDIAAAIGRSAPHISKCLSGPSNWTLDTVSDLLFAVEAEMDYTVIFNDERVKSNRFHAASSSPNDVWPQPQSEAQSKATSARVIPKEIEYAP